MACSMRTSHGRMVCVGKGDGLQCSMLEKVASAPDRRSGAAAHERCGRFPPPGTFRVSRNCAWLLGRRRRARRTCPSSSTATRLSRWRIRHRPRSSWPAAQSGIFDGVRVRQDAAGTCAVGEEGAAVLLGGDAEADGAFLQRDGAVARRCRQSRGRGRAARRSGRSCTRLCRPLVV